MVLRQGDLAKLYTFTAKKRDILGCTSLTTKGNLKGQEKILKVGRGEHNTSRSRKFAAKKSTLMEYQAFFHHYQGSIGFNIVNIHPNEEMYFFVPTGNRDDIE